MMAARFALRRGEEGSALILALVFLSLFGLLISVLLSFAETSFRTTLAVRSQGGAVYAADGVVEAAINAIRYDGNSGRYGYACPTPSLPAINGQQATVTCDPRSDSGIGGGAGTSNKPKRAILTLSTNPAEDGVKKNGSSTLYVRGGIFSNTNIRSDSGAISVDGDVIARGACAASVSATFTKACNIGNAPYPNSTDPNYPLSATFPVARSVPSCPPGPTQWLITFEPGTYTDAVALNNLTSGSGGSCASTTKPKVLWFKPGTYYFDFTTSTSSAWTIQNKDVTVVGGTPKNWVADGSLPYPTTLQVPGSCKTETDPAPNDGVMWVMGGKDTRLSVTAGKFELCAQPSSNQQQIAIYGVKTGTTTTGQLKPTGETSTIWANPQKTREIDDDPATASLSAGQSAYVNSTGFNQVTIPAGSVINDATIRLVHAESGSINKLQLDLAGTGASISFQDGNCGSAGKLCVDPNMHTDLLNVTSTFNTPGKLANFTAKYTVSTPNNKSASAQYDGVRLEVTYSPPGFQALSGCIVAQPYLGSGTCALINNDGSNSTFALQGTVYAPTAAVDVNIPNNATQILGRGAVVRVLDVGMPGSVIPGQYVIQVPAGSDDTTLSNRKVLLTASIGGVARLRALVEFDDGGGLTPGQSVKVLSWSVLR